MSPRTDFQGALPSLIHALTQCVEAQTTFIHGVEKLLQASATGQPSTPSNRELLTVRELAAAIPIGRAAIRRLAKSNQIPSTRLGNKLVFNLNAVLAALNKHKSAEKRPHGKGQSTSKCEETTL